MMMKKIRMTLCLVSYAVFLFVGTASATPSTHVWSPSTDVQSYGVVHLTHDVYLPIEEDDAGNRPNTVTNLGLTVGILPFEKINMEVGFDHIGGYGEADNYPMYYNAKIGTPEEALGKGMPAIAAGIYAVGAKTDVTDYNIYYGKIARTVPVLGRFSIGYYQGNDELLLDEDGEKDENGILLAWERTISEISDNLWVSLDYQGGNNGFGAMNYGFSWKFAPTVCVIFGYDDYNNPDLVDTFTVQMDIDLDVFSGKK